MERFLAQREDHPSPVAEAGWSERPDGQEQRLEARIQELRARLLEAHAQMIRRDEEIHKTFGDAIYERNALRTERDSLLAERAAWLEERRALHDCLGAAEQRLEILRKGPLGLAYRVVRKLIPRRRGVCRH